MIHPQIPLLLPVGGHASFDNFVIGPNAAACHHVHSACRSAGAAPVYLWGAEGTGKTHLLEAVLSDCLSQRKAAAYVPLVEPGLLDAAILEGLEAMDLVCIEDLDGIAGRAGWEEALFHLYNRCAQSACRLLLSARAARTAWVCGCRTSRAV